MSKQFLIIAPAWVGDMVMSQSLYRTLKQYYPDCVIDIVAPAHCATLAQYMPEIRHAFVADFKHGEFGLNARKAYAQQFKNKGYTDAIVLPNSWKSALIPYFAKIPQRHGWTGEVRYILLNRHRKLDKNAYPLMIERFCALADTQTFRLPKKLPYPQFRVNAQTLEQTRKAFGLNHSKPIIALCAGAEFGPAKKWPTAKFAQVAQYYADKNWQVILMGSPKDAPSCDEIMALCHQHINIISFAGKTSMNQAVEILACVDKVLSNDSGLMHIACALDKPTTVVYGSTSDKFTPPLHDQAKIVFLENIPCRPCFKRECPLGHMDCLNKLEAKMVIDTMEKD